MRTFGCQMNEHDSERIAGLLEADGYEPATGARRRRRRRAQHVLHPRERRQQALRHARPPEGAERPRDPTCRSWSAAAWPRRTAISSARGPAHVDVVFGTHNVHRAVELLHHAREHGPIIEILDEAVRDDAEAVPVGAAGAARARPRRPGSRSRSAATTPARSASCRPCGARRSAGRSTTSSPRSSGWPPTASSRSRCSARTSTATGATCTKRRPAVRRPAAAPSARSTASAGCATRARTPRTSAPRPSRRWPRRRRCASTSTCPLQSGSDRVLAAMHRGYTAERYLEKLAAARAADPRPRRHDRHHRRLPRRDRRRLRAHARGRGRGRVRQRLHVRLLAPRAAPRPRDDGRPVRAPRGRAPSASSGCGSSSSARALAQARGPRRSGRGGARRGPEQARPDGAHRPHPPEQARALRGADGRSRIGSFADVRVTEARVAPPATASWSRSPRAPRHRTRIPVAVGLSDR